MLEFFKTFGILLVAYGVLITGITLFAIKVGLIPVEKPKNDQ